MNVIRWVPWKGIFAVVVVWAMGWLLLLLPTVKSLEPLLNYLAAK